MDLEDLKQAISKKGLFSDIVFYISISCLISAVLCYFIFSAKIGSQKNEIMQIDSSMATIGTQAQKDREADIFNYQKKINDFSLLLKNRKSSLNILSFLEKQTLSNVWFNRFSLSEKDKSIALSGEAENMEVLSRQVMLLESNEYVKKIDVLSSNLGNLSRISFNLNIILDPKLFALEQTGVQSENIIETVTP